MTELILVCETSASDPSHEMRLLDGVLNGVHNCGAVVQGSGGDTGLRAVAAYLRATDRTRLVATIRDRDYRPLEWAEKKPDGPNFMWRRHELESYWLEPRVVRSAMAALAASLDRVPQPPVWREKLQLGLADVEILLQRAAIACAPAEAAVMCLWRTARELNTVGRLQLAVGAPPMGSCADECRRYVLTACTPLREAVTRHSVCRLLDEEPLLRAYDQVLSEVSQAEYLGARHYLRDFSAKSVLAAFAEMLCAHLGGTLSLGLLRQELADAVLREYGADRGLFAPDDFARLAEGLHSLRSRTQ